MINFNDLALMSKLSKNIEQPEAGILCAIVNRFTPKSLELDCCPQCDAEINNPMKFCPYCGQAITIKTI